MLRIQLKPIFDDRNDAGRRLAEKLIKYQDNAVVIAVPYGGVPVAWNIADKLEAPLDIIVSRKIPVPGMSEAGCGAITDDGCIVLNTTLVAQLGLTEVQIKCQSEEVQAEIKRCTAVFRDNCVPVLVEGKTAILTDDGLASGFTMIAAIKSLKKLKPARIIVAVPITSKAAYELVTPLVDELVSLAVAYTPDFAIASFYNNWHDLTDGEALQYLKLWREKALVQSFAMINAS